MSSRIWMLCFFALACGSSVTGGDAGTDAGADATNDASDAGAPCKIGLPDAGTGAVACGAISCVFSNVCCIGQTAECVAPASCGNLETVWACDRSAHCGSGKTCCYDLLFPDFTTCPAGTARARSCVKRTSTAAPTKPATRRS